MRYSPLYNIVGVLDSTNAGMDAGVVVDGRRREIPVFSDLKTSLDALDRTPDYLIIGVATIGGKLPPEFRPIIKTALKNGINVISGLHEFLEDDPELSEMAERGGAEIKDIRREPPLYQLHGYRDLASKIGAIKIPVLGTDSAVGKRTTAIELTRSLNAKGVRAEFVATGQTGLLQGAKYGVTLDSIQGDYMVGELETVIFEAFQEEGAEVIVIEGQGSLTHPAYVCGTRAVISASKPDAIILQHPPGRKFRNYDPSLKIPLPDLREEISLLEAYSHASVIALGISHENLDQQKIPDICEDLSEEFGIPAVDVYLEGAGRLASRILEYFPRLQD